MARLLGVDIPNRKKVEYSLRYIYGVGPTRAKEILDTVGIDPDRRTQELTEQELSLISNYIIDNKIMVEGDLRRAVTNNLKRLQSIRCYRGLRHQRGLPVRGQRTLSNGKTQKKLSRGRLRFLNSNSTTFTLFKSKTLNKSLS